MRLAARTRRLADLTGAAIFAVLFCALIVQVLRRFVFGAPAAWTEELAAIAFVWTIFWGAAFTVPLSAHVAVDLFESRLGARARRILHAVALATIALLFLRALPGILDYLVFMRREHTPVLELSYGLVYAVFGAFAVMVVVRCVLEIARPALPGELPPGAAERVSQ